MMPKSLMSTIIYDQLAEIKRPVNVVPRDIYNLALSFHGSSALVIKGIRRCGKSTMLKQIINARFPESFFYFNFDDDRISGFVVEDFQALIETFIELFGEKKNVFFDEIQNIRGWELFINRLLREGYTVFITGSSSNLLSRELGTHLTGRHVDVELYPFSFTEFLRSKNIYLSRMKGYSTPEKATMSREFKEYSSGGGMPEAVVSGNSTVLLHLISDIIQKDIMNRYSLRKLPEIRNILRFLMANVSSEITYRSLSRSLGLRSENTVKKYIEYLEETYLIFEVKRFDRKLKMVDKNPRKIYCVDNGIILKNLPNFSKNEGALLENVVAVQLKRTGKEFYYYRHDSNAEVDFVVPADRKLIQVCYELNMNNMDREIRGLVKASREIKTEKFLILTMDQEQVLKQEDFTIDVKPVWKWLVEDDAEHGQTNW
ncbi:MAG: ATP-binding protein [Candidatus Thermoplasmatota archaeon]|nr:ATP-binding protein [Candidatus Thermoplasmatota archaeon]